MCRYIHICSYLEVRTKILGEKKARNTHLLVKQNVSSRETNERRVNERMNHQWSDIFMITVTRMADKNAREFLSKRSQDETPPLFPRHSSFFPPSLTIFAHFLHK